MLLKDVKYLSKVIGYDRKQPEFFEDTITYVSKRANKFRVTQAKKVYNQNKLLFNKVEGEFGVEKEILLSLWGIETNFGKHVGKMDIISSLATLSYDKRRRDYFSSELLILLKLIDRQLARPYNIIWIMGWELMEIFNLCLRQSIIMRLIMIKMKKLS